MASSSNAPDQHAQLVRELAELPDGERRAVVAAAERLAGDLLAVSAESEGALNSNDALLVVLERDGAIDNLASFDSGFDRVEGFRRIT